MKTYDIYFSDQSSSDNKGFSIKTEEKAIHMAEDILAKGGSYIEEYAGGTISVIDSEGVTVWKELKNLRTQKLKTQYLCSQE